MIARILTCLVLAPNLFIVPMFVPGRWALLFIVGLISSFLFTLGLCWRTLRKRDRPSSTMNERWGLTLCSALIGAVLALGMWMVFHDTGLLARPVLVSRMIYMSGSAIGCGLFILGYVWTSPVAVTADRASADTNIMPERTATEGAAAVLREWRALLVTAAVIGLPFFQWHAFLAHRTMSSFVLPLFVTVATIVIFGGLIGRRSVAPVPPPKGIGGRAVGTASRGDRRVRWTIAISGTAVLFVLPADRLGMVLLVRGIFLDGWALLFAARGAALIRDYRFRRGAHAGLW